VAIPVVVRSKHSQFSTANLKHYTLHKSIYLYTVKPRYLAIVRLGLYDGERQGGDLTRAVCSSRPVNPAVYLTAVTYCVCTYVIDNTFAQC